MLTVLIVDDDREFLEEIAEILTAGGYAVSTAAGTDEAIALAERSAPDLILLDLKIPGDGLGIARVFRANDPTRRTPIIVVSGRIEEEKREMLSAELGIEHVLEKPVNPLDLIAAIELYGQVDNPGTGSR